LEDRKVDEASLVERVKLIERQKKYIKDMKDDIVKNTELVAWTKHCILFWDENPSNIIDPSILDKGNEKEAREIDM